MRIEWSVNALRLSTFSSGPIGVSEGDWRILTGQEEAPTRHAIPGGKNYSGPYLGGQFSLVVQGERVDVVLQAIDHHGEAPAVKFPVLGTLQEIEHKFIAATSSWLQQFHSKPVRLAFGVLLIAERPSLIAAYEALRSLIKSVDVNPERMREFLYRVNWPTQSKILPLNLNRLTTWTGLRVVTKLVQMTGETMSIAPGAGELNAARLEIDCNTDEANRMPFEQDKLVPLFRELVELANQIAEEGEIQ